MQLRSSAVAKAMAVFGFKVWIMMMLVVYFVIYVLIILALIFSDNDGDSDGRRAAQRDKLVFVSDHLADFNVLKAQPIDSMEDWLRHNATVHRVGKPNVVAETGAHCYCIVCRLCDASTLKDAFVCCLGTYGTAQ